MRNMHRLAAVLIALGSMLFIPLASADMTVVIIRHGEKPQSGLGQLSCQGLNRALALPNVLLPRYGKPTAIYAPNPAIKKMDKGVPYAYVRPLVTIEPLAIRTGLPVNVDWGMTDISSLVRYLLAQSNGTYVIAWEHHYGEKLAKLLLAALGSDSRVPTWKDADFDSIYVIRVVSSTQGGRQATFAREQEGLDELPETCAQSSINKH